MLERENISEVFQEAYPNLCRFLESILGRNRPEAQELAQESFLRLCQVDFDGDISNSEIRFWLFRVARNLALNEVSKSNTRRRFWRQITDVFYRDRISPEEELLKKEDRRIVRKLLDALPEHQRSALLLREQEEMSYREIALVLDISQSKVKVDIFRARQALRALWFDHSGKI